VKSSIMREISAESDALHLGMGWTFEDLEKPHVIIESTYGESHPGSSHLLGLSAAVRDGVIESGGKPALYFVTDICDGVSQGSGGMELSLLSREFIANMIEIHAEASPCDGLVLLSSCDKSLPAHLLAAARLNLPAIIMPGGCMSAGANFLAVDQLWEIRRREKNKESRQSDFLVCSASTCPSAGACQEMGTASTMQVITEALGLALPGSALIPASNNHLARTAVKVGRQVFNLIQNDIKPKDILTIHSFENAIAVHAAVGGSTNAVLHLMAIAMELGVKLDIDTFDKIHSRTPYLTNILSTGKYPTEFFWYAGGLPALMNEIKDLLHLDAITVTGKTLGENLAEWSDSQNMVSQNMYLSNYHIQPQEVIHKRKEPISKDGGIAVLKGNIAPLGALVKHSAVVAAMHHHIGPAKVFENEDTAIKALSSGEIVKGDVIVIRYQGPKACGMPEMFRISDAIACDPELACNTAVITDGRYSGCTKGPAIGYVSPEAFDGGPIALLQSGDQVEIDIPNRKLDLIQGLDRNGELTAGAELIAERKRQWSPLESIMTQGVRSIYRRLVGSSLHGARIENR
jgi:dihydroxy-acid dehydratase